MCRRPLERSREDTDHSECSLDRASRIFRSQITDSSGIVANRSVTVFEELDRALGIVAFTLPLGAALPVRFRIDCTSDPGNRAAQSRKVDRSSMRVYEIQSDEIDLI